MKRLSNDSNVNVVRFQCTTIADYVEDRYVLTKLMPYEVCNVYDSPSKSENIANSTIGLPLHTDQCHYEAGPGIQMLHAIQ